MRIRDLGVIDGEILLFGGIYSNLSAFEAVLALAQARGIAPSNMICTGDVVAYCAEAEACVTRIRALGCPVLSGNCEVQLAGDADDCGCGYGAGSMCSILSRGWYSHAQKAVTLENKVWMGTLPERIVFTHKNKKYAVVHGGASDIATFVWPVSTDAAIGQEITLLQDQVGPIDCVIAGHTGIAMDRTVDGVRWINSGAVGMPPNDGDPRGAYGILNGDAITFERFDYNMAASISAMQAAGLTQGYDRALHTGFWPSEDTLPPEMRVQSSASG